MIRFHTLGTLDLRGPEGEELGSLLTRSKRLALLVYLAIARPRGFHRRDTLLSLFWPDLDQSRARNALRQSIHYLRRSLGEGVLVSRGEGDLGIADSRLWCDAVAFEEVLDDGRTAEALELYRGELLRGFYISDAAEFERWLERERQRLTRRASSAAWDLAAAEESASNIVSAVTWARRATAFAPYDEGGLRELIRLLDRAGERARAVRAYESFAARLIEDLDLEPAPETRELIEAIRDRQEPVVGARGSPHGADNAESGDDEPAEGGSDAREPAPSLSAEDPISKVGQGSADEAGGSVRPWLQRIVRGGVAAVAAIAVLGAAWSLWPDPPSSESTVSVDRLVVFPFSFRGRAEYAYLGNGMMDLLTATLDGAGNLRTVHPRAVLRSVAEAGGDTPDPERGQAIAARLGAGRFVLGNVVEVGTRVRVSASMHDIDGGAAPIATAATEGPVEDVFEMVDRLTAELLGTSADSTGGNRLTRLAAVTTNSLPALKAYLEGEEAFRGLRFGPAIEAFERAIAADSTFALAYYRLSTVADWEDRVDLALDAAARAVRFADRLNQRDRLLLRAYLARRRGAMDEAERRYRAILASYPHDVEAWVQLGEVLFHYNVPRGRPARLSREAWQRVLEVEPHHLMAKLHLARLAAADGRGEDLDSLVDCLVEHLPGSSRALEPATLRASVLSDTAAQDSLASELRSAPADALAMSVWTVSTFGYDISGAMELAAMLTDPARPPLVRALGHAERAHLNLATGRWQAARRELGEMEPLAPEYAIEYRALISLAPFLPVPRAELEALRAELVAWNPPITAEATASEIFAPHEGFHRHMRLYLLGLLSARLEDYAAARAYAAELGALDGPPRARGLAHDLARSVEAFTAWRRGRPGDALAALRRIHTDTVRGRPSNSPFFSRSFDRYLRAMALETVGAREEALRWYDSFRENSVFDLVYVAPAHLRQGELHERLGAPEEAARHYGRFLDLWRDADSELRPLIRHAERRLSGLTGERQRGT